MAFYAVFQENFESDPQMVAKEVTGYRPRDIDRAVGTQEAPRTDWTGVTAETPGEAIRAVSEMHQNGIYQKKFALA